jgi:formamidopyrimidine-DNA glycosylase
MLLTETAALDHHPMLAGLGPEPLGNAFGADSLAEAFAGRTTPLKAALLDQRVVAGLGNIYVCEALHRARLSPFRMARDVGTAELGRLAGSIRFVLNQAIEAGGATLRDYRQGDGSEGAFQHEFAVYDRAGGACPQPSCGGTIERQVQAGRSTYYCATCQS